MYLILAESTDRVAAATARHLPPADTYWLTPAHLVAATWTHRVDDGGASWTLSAAGSTIQSREIDAVLNRLLWLPPSGMRGSGDIEYAAMEWHALVISALATLGTRVVNPPCPPNLSGPSWTTAEVLHLAHGLGLPVRAARITTDGRRHPAPGWERAQWRRWLVPQWAIGQADTEPVVGVPVGPRPVVWLQPVQETRTCWVVGDQCPGSRAGDPDLRPLAEAMGCDLLAVTIAQSEQGAVVCAAEPFPTDVEDSVAAGLAVVMTTRIRS